MVSSFKKLAFRDTFSNFPTKFRGLTSDNNQEMSDTLMFFNPIILKTGKKFHFLYLRFFGHKF
jgi:hypothetical protein